MKKIITWHDYAQPTGQANIAKHLLKGLTSHAEVHTVAINYTKDAFEKVDGYTHFVYPTQAHDYLGLDLLEELVTTHQPDSILLMHDAYNISLIIDLLRKASPNSKIITYFPVTAAPFSLAWQAAVLDADEAYTFNYWGKHVVDYVLGPTHLQVLTAGVDHETFGPLPKKQVRKLRKENNWEKTFTLVNANRYAPEKNIASTLRAYSMLIKGYLYCDQCDHVTTVNQPCCELCQRPAEQLVATPKFADDMCLYLHMNTQETSMGPFIGNSLPNLVLAAGLEQEDLAQGRLQLYGGNIYQDQLEESWVNQLYNAANIMVNTSFGEATGLTILEANATGTPTLAVNAGGTSEYMPLQSEFLIKPKAVVTLPQDNAYSRPVTDELHLMQLIMTAYQNWVDNNKEKLFYPPLVKISKSDFSWGDKRLVIQTSLLSPPTKR